MHAVTKDFYIQSSGPDADDEPREDSMDVDVNMQDIPPSCKAKRPQDRLTVERHPYIDGTLLVGRAEVSMLMYDRFQAVPAT